jgi:hypothetical protein
MMGLLERRGCCRSRLRVNSAEISVSIRARKLCNLRRISGGATPPPRTRPSPEPLCGPRCRFRCQELFFRSSCWSWSCSRSCHASRCAIHLAGLATTLQPPRPPPQQEQLRKYLLSICSACESSGEAFVSRPKSSDLPPKTKANSN